MRIAVTRPEEDAGPLMAKLAGMGHKPIAAPVLTIRPRSGVIIPEREWQALVATSANGIRALTDHEQFRKTRMLTVGPQSLKAAQAAGFRAEAHGGDVHGLADFIRRELDPEAGPILYLSGAEISGDLERQLKAAGFDCHRAVLYDAVAAEDLGAAAPMMRAGELDGVMLYSPRTAKLWHSLAEKAGLAESAGHVVYFCLSRNVAAVLPETWDKRIATAPNEAAMLALLEETR
jgi:uroporphyrinogen-III synthase